MTALGEQAHLSAYIIIHGPGHDGTRLALREGITSFGRLPSNDVILLGDLVSRHHSRITFFEGKATLQDLGSHNGSWVNDEKVTTRVLHEGDTVRIGNFRLSFHEGAIGSSAENGFEETTAGEHERATAAPSPGRVEVPEPRARTIPSRAAGIGAGSATAAAAGVGAGASPPAVEADREGGGDGAGAGSLLIQEIERVRNAKGDLEGDPQALLLLYRSSEALGKALSLKAYLDELMVLVLDQIRARVVAFFRAPEGQGEPLVAAARDRGGPRPELPVVPAISRMVVQKNMTISTGEASQDHRFSTLPGARELPVDARAVGCVPIAARKRVLGALYLAREMPFTDHELDVLQAIGHLSVLGIERAEVREQLLQEGLQREMLSRFHSPDVVEQILKSTRPSEPPRPLLEKKTATISFCDIQGFGALAERLEVQEVSEFLNAYYDQMSDITLKHRGTIDKFLGGGMMSIFGAPFSYGNDAGRAVAAALEMRDAFDALVRARPHVGPRRLRVGLSTGWLLAGTVGSQRRLEYTAIGDAVNTASRLEASAAPGAILISESTYALVEELFDIRKLGLQQIRGRAEPLQVYEVLGRKRGASRAR